MNKAISIFAIACSSIFNTIAAATDDAEKPNIVYIMADDLGWADVGYNGAEFYETPNVDALCAAGMKFNSAYPGAANCMPSRACIMTGMYLPRTQMWTPGTKSKGDFRKMKFLVPRKGDKKGDAVFPSNGALEPAVESLAEVLGGAGYKTAHFGKWHLGPDGQGFDVNDTNGLGAGLNKKFYGNVDVAENLTTAACKLIEDSRDTPFFIYLCHWDVHTPIRVRKEVVKKYKKKLEKGGWARKWNPTNAAMIEAVDTSVGRIRAALEKNGLTENTLIMFTSDNGGHGSTTWCEPLKGGQSWVPLLSGADALSERPIFWHYPLYLDGAGYNKVLPVHGTKQNYWRATPCSVIRQGDWKLIKFFESDSVQLFNLKDDIGEQNDLAKSNPEKASGMLKELKAWQVKTEAVIPTELNPDFGSTRKNKKKKNK